MTAVKYSIFDTSYNVVEIGQQDRITSIAGKERDLYITAVEPVSQGSHYRFRTLARTPVIFQRFSHIDTVSRSPVYFPEEVAIAQVKTIKGSQWKTEIVSTHAIDGPDAPQSREFVYFDNANQLEDFGVIRAIASDESRGLMFSELMGVQYIPAPTIVDADPDEMKPGTSTPGTPIDLEYVFIELKDQYLFVENQTVRAGDAILKVRRDLLTLDQITEDGATFEITPPGQQPIRYQIWEMNQGVQSEQTYHWTIYLNKIKGQT